jgi:hypothetical protein
MENLRQKISPYRLLARRKTPSFYQKGMILDQNRRKNNKEGLLSRDKNILMNLAMLMMNHPSNRQASGSDDPLIIREQLLLQT